MVSRSTYSLCQPVEPFKLTTTKLHGSSKLAIHLQDQNEEKTTIKHDTISENLSFETEPLLSLNLFDKLLYLKQNVLA